MLRRPPLNVDFVCFHFLQILLNRGLLLFSKNDFVSAQENFEKAAMAAAASSHEQPNNSEGKLGACFVCVVLVKLNLVSRMCACWVRFIFGRFMMDLVAAHTDISRIALSASRGLGKTKKVMLFLCRVFVPFIVSPECNFTGTHHGVHIGGRILPHAGIDNQRPRPKNVSTTEVYLCPILCNTSTCLERRFPSWYRVPNSDEWNWTVLDESTDLLGSALNNLSLAMVYSCDVMRGVRTLEGLIRKDPPLYMLDVVVFNLCTLYDLSFDAATSAAKKRTLQAVAQRFRLEDIDSSSFRTN